MARVYTIEKNSVPMVLQKTPNMYRHKGRAARRPTKPIQAFRICIKMKTGDLKVMHAKEHAWEAAGLRCELRESVC